MPDDPKPAAAAPAPEPAKEPAGSGKTATPKAAASIEAASAALDAALEAELSNETKKPAGELEEVKAPDASKATKTDDQPSDLPAKKDEDEDEPKEPQPSDEPVVDFGESKTKDEDEDEQQKGFPKDWPEAAVKNLLKEREKRKAARQEAEEKAAKLAEIEARAKELESENTRLKESPERKAQPAPEVSAIQSKRELDEFKRKQQELRDSCEVYADGYPETDKDGNPVLDGDGNPVMRYTKRQVAEIKVKAMRALESDIPAREKFLQDREAHDADAMTRYPWLKNDSSKAAAEVKRIRDNWQTIANGPGITRLIVWALRGRELEFRENSASKNAKPTEKPSPQPSKPASERPSPSKASAKEARKQAASTAIRGGKNKEAALEEFLAAEMSED